MMNDKYLVGLTVFSALGCGVMAGLFFVFSVFMMRALDRLPAAQGIAAMQSINKTIITPLFLLMFMGTAVACAVLVVVSLFRWDQPYAIYLLIGGLLYLVGVIMLTGGYHVPRNDALDALDPNTADAASYWRYYVTNWTAWNHVRTVSSVASTVLLTIALRVG
jgi:uncharacterized membrane protein